MDNNKVSKIARKIPNNLEAEQSVLGCCLIDDNSVLTVMEELKPQDFYTKAHETIFESMYNIYNASKPIDYVTLTDDLERRGVMETVGGIDYITTLTNIVPSAANVKHYIEIVKRDALLRRLIHSSQEIIEEAYDNEGDNILADAEKKIFDIAEKEDKSALVPMSEVLDSVLNKFEEISKNAGMPRGIPTGFSGLDNLLNGLQKSDLILLAARPGFGKTSLAMNIVSHAALVENKKCAVFSLEMPIEQIAQRTLCSVSGVSMQSALSGKLSQDDWKALWEGNKEMAIPSSNIYIDDSSLNTPTTILSKCRRLKRAGGLDLIMIDYLQLMSTGKQSKDMNRQLEIAEMTRTLKIAARELQVPILLLSQLSRDVEKRKEDHRPMVSDLRDSGAIEQDADIIMFIYDASFYGDTTTQDGPDIREIIVAKHRNGPQGTVKVRWIPEITTFMDIETQPTKVIKANTNIENFEIKKSDQNQEDAIDESEIPPPPDDFDAPNDIEY